MAEAYDVAIAPHCPLGPIALAACLQVGLTTPNHVIQEMSQGIHYNKEAGEFDLHSYITDPSVFDVQDGFVMAPKGPGLGIEINEDFVRKIAKTAVSWPLQGFIATSTGDEPGIEVDGRQQNSFSFSLLFVLAAFLSLDNDMTEGLEGFSDCIVNKGMPRRIKEKLRQAAGIFTQYAHLPLALITFSPTIVKLSGNFPRQNNV
ncbi:MAG: hypothetical protein Q9165_007687 [Trypethelium subeluteriae]